MEWNLDDGEPDRSLIWIDQDGDIWSFEDGEWKYRSRVSPVRYPGGAWDVVCRSYPTCFPWTTVRAPVPEEGGFVVKDSGVREEYANGFVRDTEDGKPDLTAALIVLYQNPAIVDVITRPGFDLLPTAALIRWADHMEKGAQKYGRNNWTQARGPVAIARFCRSLIRHVAQYISGDRTEDHAAAICFNVWAAELTPEAEVEQDV